MTPGTSTSWWAAEIHEVVVVSGEDAASYLEGQLAQSIVELEIGRGSWSLLLEPDGTLGHLLGVARSDAQRFVLHPGEGRASEVVARLRRFVLRAKVAIEVVPMAIVEMGDDRPEVAGPRLPSVLGATGARVIEASPLDPLEQISMGEVTSRRLEQGLPAEAEGIAGVVPLALGEATVAVAASFTKGCYTGQELVARTTSRNAPPPVSIVPFRARHQVAPGELIACAGEEVGHVIESAWWNDAAVGFVAVARRALKADAGEITSDGGPLDLTR